MRKFLMIALTGLVVPAAQSAIDPVVKTDKVYKLAAYQNEYRRHRPSRLPRQRVEIERGFKSTSEAVREQRYGSALQRKGNPDYAAGYDAAGGGNPKDAGQIGDTGTGQ